MFSERPTNRD
uniref:Uncharacterized protein n=1 Tax=Arundo donax TaxID=35708 RepID=A0A0A8Z0G5_ARUDO